MGAGALDKKDKKNLQKRWWKCALKTARGNVNQLLPYKCTTLNGGERRVVGWIEFRGGESGEKKKCASESVELCRLLEKMLKTPMNSPPPFYWIDSHFHAKVAAGHIIGMGRILSTTTDRAALIQSMCRCITSLFKTEAIIFFNVFTYIELTQTYK